MSPFYNSPFLILDLTDLEAVEQPPTQPAILEPTSLYSETPDLAKKALVGTAQLTKYKSDDVDIAIYKVLIKYS